MIILFFQFSLVLTLNASVLITIWLAQKIKTVFSLEFLMDFFNNKYKNNEYYRIAGEKEADGQDHSGHSPPHSHHMMTVTAPLSKLLTWRTHDGTYNAPTVCGRSCFLLEGKENVEEERKEREEM